MVLAKAKLTKRAAPFLDSRLYPGRDSAWTKSEGKSEAETTVAWATEMAEVASGGAVPSAHVLTRAALAEAAKAMAERELAGTWVASVTEIVHSMAIAGCFSDGGWA